MHNGTCVNIEEEQNEDGVCNFDNAGCFKGDYEEISNFADGKVWRCRGKGTGKSQDCRMAWECRGSCSLDTDSLGGFASDACGSAYSTDLSKFGESACKSAGVYYYKCPYNSQASIGRCYGLDPFDNNPSCSSMVSDSRYSQRCNNEWVNYSIASCLKWNAKLSCVRHILGNNPETYENSDAISKCSAISSKKPACSSSESRAAGNGGTNYQISTKCEIDTSGYPMGCTAVYHGGSMVANSVSNAVTGMTNTSNNIGGWTSYCNSKTTPSACNSIGVVRFQPSPITEPNVVLYRGATLPYNTSGGPTDVQTAKCCKWNDYN